MATRNAISNNDMQYKLLHFSILGVLLVALLSIACTVVDFFGTQQLKNVTRKVGKTVSASVPAFSFLQLDEPLKLELRIQEYDETASVIIASAIRQHDKVAFIVIEAGIPIPGYEKPRQALPALPRGLGCAFTNEVASQNNKAHELAPTSMIEIYAHTLRGRNSSSIWMCDMPASSNEWRYVSVVLPEWAKRVTGNGVFNISERLSTRNLSGKINACNKHVFYINNMTSRHLNEYTEHYRRLGVIHFTFYFEQGTGENVFDLTNGIKNHTHEDIRIILIPQNLRQLWNPKSRIQRLQSFTSNDCLWRSKAEDLNWTLMMFDLDEFLVGTTYLPSFLSNWSSPLVYVRHHLVKFPHDMPRIYPGKHLNISEFHDSDYGKSIYRTGEVSVAWTHHPTAPQLPRKESEQLKLLHFRNVTRVKFQRKSHKWVEFIT